MDAEMEGWLFLIRLNRLGLQYSRKRYFVLNHHLLSSFKTIPAAATSHQQQEASRSAMIDSWIRVTDNGRETLHRKVFFIFTIYNTSNHNDQLKLGASSPEEAARWIRSLQNAALKESQEKDFVGCSKRKWSSLRLRGSKRREKQYSIDWTFSSIVHSDAMASDVIAPSPWKIFGCQNGLRLFKEAKDWDSRGRHWDDHPAIMAVGIVDGTSEAIFRTLMSLGSSRSEWDFCFYRGSVVEHLDGHTDIVHKLLYSDWLPWGMRRRDLLVRRYWRREDDGTYVILYHSVIHKKCPPQKGYVRACLKSGGFVVSPINQGKQSLVRHMLAIDWKYWKLYLRPSSARSITIRMLERLAALGELFRFKSGNDTSEMGSSVGFLTQSVKEEIENEAQYSEEAKESAEVISERPVSGRKSLTEMNDAADEFFDVFEPGDSAQFDSEWSPELTIEEPKSPVRTLSQPKLSSAAVFVKKLQELRAQKKGYADLHDGGREGSTSCIHGATLPKDATCALPCSWSAGDPSSFLVRGANYLRDRQKVTARGTSMQLVGVDWLKSDKREDNLGSRPNSIVQKYADMGGSEFFFIVNIQVPGGGTSMHTLAMYYMTKEALEDNPLLESFVNGDDAFRNSRFKLIPYISKGSWIVKQSVGKKACLVGQALESLYFRGTNYLEVEIDVASSTVARGVASLVLGYLNNLVIEMAFLIQANTKEELPEQVLGTCRLNHLDASNSKQLI